MWLRDWLRELQHAMRNFPAVLARAWLRARQTARSAIGVPDYDTYLRHCREHHAERPPMSYAQFFNERQASRYRGTGGRCC